jgi:Flp pilus assembly protein TadD
MQAEQLRERERIEAAVREQPGDEAPLTVEDRLRRGDGLRRDDDYAGAMWNYLQAHELDPGDPRPIAQMASLHLLSDPAQAEEMFLQLSVEHPDSGAARTGLGLARIEREDWDGAREALERAVDLSPTSAPAHSALGVCLDRMDDREGARRSYERALALHPRYYEALNNLGVSYLTTEEFERAVDVLRQAAQQQPRDPAVFNNLGLALGRLGRYDEAFDAFRRVGSIQAAHNNLGYVLYLNGEPERAIAEYEKALLASGDQRLRVLRNLRAAGAGGSPKEISAAEPSGL